jgi:hypothetical protein
MKERLNITGTFRIVTIALIAIGAAAFITGIFTDTQRAWSSYLIVNYYFFSLSIGAAFFLTLQFISQSGWSSGFLRVPEAMMAYIPFAAAFFLLLYFGYDELYNWSHSKVVADDPVLIHKSPYLNIPFFFSRMIIFFALWIIFVRLLTRTSRQMDNATSGDIMQIFDRNEYYSKVFIFIFAISFSLSSFDWIMSLDPHWYSTIFALKNLVSAFLHGVTVVALIVFILNRYGFFPFLNEFHLHDFARYIFMLSIIWGYFWFSQFMIIWYGNIPEETIYYYLRWQKGWEIFFWLGIILNWAIPFMVLLPVQTSRNKSVIIAMIILLIIGQYIDLYFQVVPATTGVIKFGFTEIGMFLGYAGLFALVIATALSRSKIIPVNHPYLEESLKHKFN